MVSKGIIQDMDFLRRRLKYIFLLLILFQVILSLTGCQNQGRYTPTQETQITETEIPQTPTPTSIPMAATVNGIGISQAFYEGEIARYMIGLQQSGKESPTDAEIRTIVLDDLISQTLLAQGAEEAGFIVSDEDYLQAVSDLVEEVGGEDVLSAWKSDQGYDEASFEIALRLSIAAAHQRDLIIASIPENIELIHAQQIFAYTKQGAERALAELNAGVDFDEVAWEYDLQTGGELGWFPPGYLTVAELNTIVMALNIGERSEIVESELGYHIIRVLGRDTEHQITTDALFFVQRQAISDWLSVARDQAEIIINN
ncbi:MAG: SurA N-terminal domain-containing protein [Anaerolineaceae bacterium]|nr:SurA N-terminal domain-containing protein [Anaerolineaceae bacterium]